MPENSSCLCIELSGNRLHKGECYIAVNMVNSDSIRQISNIVVRGRKKGRQTV